MSEAVEHKLLRSKNTFYFRFHQINQSNFDKKQLKYVENIQKDKNKMDIFYRTSSFLSFCMFYTCPLKAGNTMKTSNLGILDAMIIIKLGIPYNFQIINLGIPTKTLIFASIIQHN